jgi:antitoxin ParD1/3/4
LNEKISITLPSEMVEEVKARVEAGRYASNSDVMRAALAALDREEQLMEQVVDTKIREALDDDRRGIPADLVFARLEKLHAAKMRDE